MLLQDFKKDNIYEKFIYPVNMVEYIPKIDINNHLKGFLNELEEEISFFGQMEIQKELNQQKKLAPEDKVSEEVHDNFNLEKELIQDSKDLNLLGTIPETSSEKYNTINKYLRK
ncbi:hypothetical protein O181_012613 [Austropuccinia psidii MF-1]|uniref:Uncharacterized protein n=1 Tax=Austropuccinia psidii MF-1 TaxID=1389203 RepID=A0A9Q3GMD0_9BASI|nr:hypothetical protein [Austropuccinia psidii MF-1]